MKHLKYILPFFLCFFCACENDEEEFVIQNQVDAGNVKLVELRADHRMMLPDGKATMKFYPKAYNILELPDYSPTYKGDTAYYIPSIKCDTSLIPASMLPEGLFHLYDEYGNEYPDFTYTTDDTTPRVIRFHLKAGELRSADLPIEIRPMPTSVYEELEIPVIFHVLNQAATPGVANIEIKASSIINAIDRMNKVFSGNATTDPNAWDARIKFVPALYDNNGALLEEPGMHVFEVPSTVVFEKDKDFSDYVLEQSEELLYDYKHFLNIWLINNPKGSATIVSAPVIMDKDVEPIPGLKVEDEPVPFPSKPEDVGFFVGMSQFVNPRQNTDYFEISTVMGKYLGLLVTQAYDNSVTANFKDGDTDYCPDTAYYWSAGQTIYKNTRHTAQDEDVFYFTSYNIMDGYSYKNSITLDQVHRIRQVLEKCSSRWMYKSKFALTGKMD